MAYVLCICVFIKEFFFGEGRSGMVLSVVCVNIQRIRIPVWFLKYKKKWVCN